jgi:hypothetical protein
VEARRGVETETERPESITHYHLHPSSCELKKKKKTGVRCVSVCQCRRVCV